MIIVLGLSLAFSAVAIIGHYIRYELSYESGFTNHERIFRVTRQFFGATAAETARTCPPLGDTALGIMPGLESYTRMLPVDRLLWSLNRKDNRSINFFMKNCVCVDPSFCNIFGLNFSAGDAKNALRKPDEIILTESMARTHFGDENPIGQTLILAQEKVPFTVCGVVRDLPGNTHISFDCLISMEVFFRMMENQGNGDMRTMTGWDGPILYVMKKPRADTSALISLLPELTWQIFSNAGFNRDTLLSKTRYNLQPITDIHLRSKLIQETSVNSDMTIIYIFSAIAILILIIAAVNTINLFSALSLRRNREIAVRKLLGSSSWRIILHSIVESYMYILCSLIPAILTMLLFSPFYQRLTGHSLQSSNLLTPSFWLPLLGIIASFGIAVGFYPALVLNRFDPLEAIKGMKTPGSKGARIRKGLVVLQFTLATAMIFSTLVVVRQLRFFSSFDLGFDPEDTLALPFEGDLKREFLADPETAKVAFLQNAVIRSAALSNELPGDGISYSLEPLYLQSEPNNTKRPSLRWMRVDEDFLKTLNIPVTAGRGFSRTTRYDSAIILNRTAAATLPEKDLIGKTCRSPSGSAEIVGIVEDFYFASLHNVVEPLVISYNPKRAQYLLLRTEPGQMSRAVELARKVIREMAPHHPFSFQILTDHLNRLYMAEKRTGSLFSLFASLGIFIACLGLLGLALYSGEVRRKEVGIRKVLGISRNGAAWLLFRENLFAVFIATLIAFAAGSWLMNRWLSRFTVHTRIGADIFLITLALSLLASTSAVIWQISRSARTNPAESLKCE